jgi:ankyrin repeat protein
MAQMYSTENFWTLLNTVTLIGHMEVFRELLKHGAKLESANNNDWTTLNTAALTGHV